MRQYAEEELGITPFEELDAAIEEIIVLMRGIRSRPHSEEEREIYGLGPNETTDEETKTA